METTTILKDILLNSKNLEFDKCAISRVYDRTDKEKKANLLENNAQLITFAILCKIV